MAYIYVNDKRLPRGSIYTTIIELGPKRSSPLWFLGPDSIISSVYGPSGLVVPTTVCLLLHCGRRSAQGR